MKTNDCMHEKFEAACKVTRLTDSGTFRFDATVRCVQCGEAFRFLGVPVGIMQPHACVSADGCELSVAVEPEGQKRFATHIPIYMPKLPDKV